MAYVRLTKVEIEELGEDRLPVLGFVRVGSLEGEAVFDYIGEGLPLRGEILSQGSIGRRARGLSVKAQGAILRAVPAADPEDRRQRTVPHKWLGEPDRRS